MVLNDELLFTPFTHRTTDCFEEFKFPITKEGIDKLLLNYFLFCSLLR